MGKQKTVRLQDLLGLLNTLYPSGLAEDWDNVGLQVGDPAAEVSRVLICLDAEEKALAAAEESGAQLVISHHPLIYRPLKKITPAGEAGRVLFRAMRNGIAVASLHTNLDRAVDGLNDWLAAALGLQNCRPLEAPQPDQFYKLVVYVPQGHESRMMEAIFAGGAGQIGKYDCCSFRTSGTGTFRPGDGTEPFIGRPGELESAEEIRLETILPRSVKSRVIAKMIKAHPYEEVAYDLVPLANQNPEIGLGRIGRLPEPLSLSLFAEKVKEGLKLDSLRVVGDLDQTLEKIAVCGGSGISLFAEAQRQGADCLVTGDVKFHDAQRARSEGLALIDGGHFGTEHLMVEELSKRLRDAVDSRKWPIEFIELKTEQDPFRTI